jgi:3-dehydroquinate dehydratase
MRKILVINGPNLNLLGEREKHIYGVMPLEQMNEKIINHFKDQSIHIDFFQGNHEGEIIDKIQKARTAYSGVVINPGAYSHYSIAILDAIKSVDMPFIEYLPCRSLISSININPLEKEPLISLILSFFCGFHFLQSFSLSESIKLAVSAIPPQLSFTIPLIILISLVISTSL